jgi:hypothetical protein
MSNEKFFSTRDLLLAATLVTLEFDLERVDYQIEGIKQYPIGYFCFKDTPELREAELKYSRRELLTEPRLQYDNLRELKAKVTNTYKNPMTDFSQMKKVV